jgi:sialate O-acetylesterase
LKPSLTLLVGCLSATAAGAPQLAPVFRDHAVLQSGRAISVWGRAAPGEHVSVAFAGQTAGSTAGADGRWVALLAPLAPNTTGTDLTVTSRQSVVVHDVAVGEVWVCAGAAAPASSAAPGSAAEGFGSLSPVIRRFGFARDAADGAWTADAPGQGPPSADLFFARDLFARLGVPIGIVACQGPDAAIEAWMSPSALAPFPLAEAGPVAPSSLFSSRLQPLLPLAARGVIWFQGSGDIGRAAGFAERFPALITAWRSHFGAQDLPFYWAQLPGRRAPQAPLAGLCAPLREAQERALALPGTAEAVTVDMTALGRSPVDAREIGRRLALIAKAGAYEIPEDDSGPVFAGASAEGPAMRVRFARGADALAASGRPLQSFEVAGADRVFHAATAAIDGATVVVRSPAVSRPVAVRYAWSDAPDANLFNGAGLPAAPFRSDNW